MALQDFEQVSYRSGSLSQHTGYAQEVIQSVGATRTLLPRESGALCLFDSAAGNIFTLPPPVVGMTFEFRAIISVTSNAFKIITNATTVFLVGGIEASTLTAGGQDYFVADGTTIRALSAAGATTGGLIGERYVVTAISATQWSIHGVTCGSGTLATPFATS